MKRLVAVLALLFLFVTAVCWAGPFDAWDKEAFRASQFVRDILGGDEFDKLLKEDYPESKIDWGGRISTTDEYGGTVYLIYCEISQPEKEPVYYYYEVTFSSVSNNPSLRKKYNIN
ncbi:MAG: hypothetical protein P9M06_00065 [Candidatus Saelkia tenebricola]|nr:hypothetical protein [Candidatus Saelkia tenebricola]